MMTGRFLRLFTACLLLCANLLYLAPPSAAAVPLGIPPPAITVGTGGYACTEAGLNQAVTDLATGGTITFSCPTASITLTSEIVLDNGQTIDGTNAPYSQMTLSGGDSTRLFKIMNSGEVVTFQKLTLTHGNHLTDNGYGGAIYNYGGLLHLDNIQLVSNTANHGGAIYNGGWISMTNSLVANNTAETGGAIRSEGGLNIEFSTFAYNQATGSSTAGAIDTSNGLIVNISTFYSNTAGIGPSAGAIYANTASPVRELVLEQSTLADNRADTGGAASLWVEAGTFRVGRSILSASGQDNCLTTSPAGIFSSQDYNLVSDTSCAFDSYHDKVYSSDMKLGPLQDNGGATPTILPLNDSPVLFAIPKNDCDPYFPTDQRGVTRPQGGACDIGAVEAVVNLSLDLSGPASVMASAPMTYTLSYTYTGEIDLQPATVSDQLPPGVILQGATSSTGTCSVVTDSILRCDLGTLDATGSSGTITISATAPDLGGISIMNNVFLGWMRSFKSSNQVTTQVMSVPTPPSITQEPQDATVVVGESATLSVTAEGEPAPTYQWYRGIILSTHQPITGATDASYTPPTQTSGTYHYWVRVSNDNGTLNSRSVTVTVNPASTETTLTAEPNPSRYGQSVTFTATVSAVAPGTGTPTGSVQFYANGTPLEGAVTLVNGTATLSTTTLVASIQTITATYSGDANYTTSTAASTNQQIIKAETTTSVTASPNPSTVDQTVVVTATISVVAPGAGTPTGTVTFLLDGTPYGSAVTLDSNGQASITLPSLSATLHSIEAVYNGDANFVQSNNSIPLIVNAPATTTSVTSSVDPSTYGQSVTFTAVVTATAGIPDGTVQFAIDGVPAGSPATLNASGLAQYTTSLLDSGVHTITASYSGSANYAASSSVGLTQTVTRADTTTTLTSSMNPSIHGQNVTFTAVVTSGVGVPTGTVQFLIDTVAFDSPVTLDANGQASYSIDWLDAGTHEIRAIYSSSLNYGTSKKNLDQEVDSAATTLTLDATPNPASFGQTVMLTATVAVVAPGAGTPDGSVEFFVDGNSAGSPVTLNAGGQATLALPSLAAGTHAIMATYSGSLNFAGSIGGLSQQVDPAATTTTLTSDQNPSAYRQSVTFTATVTSPAGVPTGTVDLYVDGTLIGSSLLSNGDATFSGVYLMVGSHPITATFTGSDSYAASTSQVVTQVVNAIPTTTDLTTAPNPSLLGDPVTLTATVAPDGGPGGCLRTPSCLRGPSGSMVPTGSLQFYVDGTPFGNPVALDGNGQAVTTTTTLSTGSHPITATYSGDAYFATSTAQPVTQVVNAGGSTAGVEVSPASAMKLAQPNSTVTYQLTVTNTGTASDSYAVTLGSHRFTTTLSTATVGPLAPGASANVIVSVTIPFNSNPYDQDTVIVTVQSTNDPSRSATSTLTTKQAFQTLVIVARGATSGW